MREFETISYTEEDGLAVVKLNRPESLNAISFKMAEEFVELARTLADAQNVRVVILTGEGRGFSTGRDLKESTTHTKEMADQYQRYVMAATSLWARLPMPTIAAINGHTFGWGVEITLVCDIRLAAVEATLCFPECSLGIFPGAGGVVWLQRVMPAGQAKELVYTSKRIDGKEAERIGLVNKAHPLDVLMDEATAIAEKIRGNGPLGVRGAKKAIDQTLDMPLSQAIEFSNALRLPLNHTKDFAEALAAFKEKRKPVFTGE